MLFDSICEVVNRGNFVNVLIVVAHPDDEVLGCGATASVLAKQGMHVRTCILSGRAEVRTNSDPAELVGHMNEAQKIMGLPEPIVGDFPNLRLNTVPHIDLVRFVEDAIAKHEANLIFTHHPSDINNDHHQASIACQVASRMFLRKDNAPDLKGLYYMEVLSSTDWAYPGTSEAFRPDTFFSIGDALETKIKAIEAYKGVLRKHPHSRSREVMRALATCRGAMSGCEYAEAFQTAFHRMGD